ncbi:WXG100 family type VII secretion target [Streptomyces sp. NPDC054863]
MSRADLAASNKKLTDLADDLEAMQVYLNNQVKRMDAIVDEIEAGWRGPTARTYRSLHRGAAKDAVRIRETMKQIEAAVRMARDGFTTQELDRVLSFQKIEVATDIGREVDALSTPNLDAAKPTKPSSRLGDL